MIKIPKLIHEDGSYHVARYEARNDECFLCHSHAPLAEKIQFINETKSYDFEEVREYDGETVHEMHCGICGFSKPRCGCVSALSDAAHEQRKKAFADNAPMSKWTFENADNISDGTKICKAYAEKFDPASLSQHNLLIYGNCGTGKSVLAACIANALIDRLYTVLFTSVDTVANRIWNKDRQEEYDRLSVPDLLVIDDLGRERSSEYMHEVALNMVNARNKNKKPFVITTNATPQMLMKASDTETERIMSRICENTIPLLIKGTDRRRSSMLENRDRYISELLDSESRDYIEEHRRSNSFGEPLVYSSDGKSF